MPAKDPLGGKCLLVIPGRVDHQLHDAPDTHVRVPKASDHHSKASRNRRSDWFWIEMLAFDCARCYRLQD